jgi:hypothetical protein
MNTFNKAACLCLPMLLASCCSEHWCNAVTKFRSDHPTEFSKYLYIYPVSLDTYYYLQGQQHAAITRVARLVEKKYAATPGLNEYVEIVLANASKDKTLAIEDYAELKKLSAGGGTICQFKWNDGQMEEMGMLILKDGSITKRDVWVTNFQSENTNK